MNLFRTLALSHPSQETFLRFHEGSSSKSILLNSVQDSNTRSPSAFRFLRIILCATGTVQTVWIQD